MQLIVGAGRSAPPRPLPGRRGQKVRLVTRSGSGPEHPRSSGSRPTPADATELRPGWPTGAEVVYNAANPPYHRWPELWPPMAGAMLAAAKDNDAVLVITGNLYGYGPVDRPMTEDMPLAATTVKGKVRVKMWQDALASGVRVIEARGSDYIGAQVLAVRAGAAGHARRQDRLDAGPARHAAHLHVHRRHGPHVITLADDSRAWGRAWHVPSAAPMTVRELLERTARVAGLPAPKLATYPVPGGPGGRAVRQVRQGVRRDELPVRAAVRAGLVADHADVRPDAHAG